MMNRDQRIDTLRAHEPELRAAGVRSLSVFGSLARQDARPHSDVDLLIDGTLQPHVKSNIDRELV